MLVKGIADGGSENNPPSLGKKTRKEKKSHSWKAHPTRKYKNVSLFAAHGVPMFFLSLKPPHWVEYER